MNKHLIEEFIPIACKALENNKTICQDGKISSTLKGNIASFGAAIRMGSLLSAAAFFSQQGGASEPRQELLNVILEVLKEHKDVPEDCTSLFAYICERRRQDMAQMKNLVVSAAVAVKLAMNMFKLEDKPEEKTSKQEKAGA